VPRHRRYWLVAADELPHRGYGCGYRAEVFPVERAIVTTATATAIDRAAIGQETLVEKLICHYPAYEAKRLRIVNIVPGIYTCVSASLESAPLKMLRDF